MFFFLWDFHSTLGKSKIYLYGCFPFSILAYLVTVEMSGRLNIYMWDDASKFTLQMVNVNKKYYCSPKVAQLFCFEDNCTLFAVKFTCKEPKSIQSSANFPRL